MNYITKFFYIFTFFSLVSQTSFAYSFEDWYNSLSEKEKIAQVFVTGIQSKHLTAQESRILNEWPVGGIIYFKRNFKNETQFSQLHASLLAKIKYNPFTFTDQEGGDVVRIGSSYDTPSPLAMGSLNSKKVTEYLGQASGSLLKDLQISSNLAPVVDIKSTKDLDFISNRSYGSSTKLVTDMSLAFSQGLINSGILPTLKHFPGIGGIKSDSHKKATIKKASLKGLLENEWKPYSEHAKRDMPFFVMTSHTKLILDKKDLGVVTYSEESLKHLRQITSQEQVVITDDLEMGGAKSQESFESAALKSFLAGHDLILIGWPGKKLASSLNYFYSMRKDPKVQERLKESLKRLYELRKTKLQLSQIAQSFSKKKSLKLTSVLNSKISNYFLSKEFLRFNREPANANGYYFYSSDPVFRRAFNKKEAASLINSKTNDIGSNCSERICFLHVTGTKTAAKAKQVLMAQPNSRFIVLNSTDPNFITGIDSAIKVINVYTKSYRLGSQLKSLLKQSNRASFKKKKPNEKVAFAD